MRIALGIAAAVYSLPALAPVAPPVARALRIPRTLPRDDVHVTFDDGPHPEGTPRVLDILDTAGVKATFFLVGERVQAAPDVAAEIARRGHEIAVHGHRHRNLLRLTPGQIARDLDQATATIAEATGAVPSLHRAPYGIYSWQALTEVRRRGLDPLLWSKWGHDWRAHRTPRQISDEATEALGPGDVILLHDADDYSAPGSWRNTVAALPDILTACSTAARTSGFAPPSRSSADPPGGP
jgi:peptidoglycan/xylan/chitin deacetylase (PgdA/CDA1 family)